MRMASFPWHSLRLLALALCVGFLAGAGPARDLPDTEVSTASQVAEVSLDELPADLAEQLQAWLAHQEDEESAFVYVKEKGKKDKDKAKKGKEKGKKEKGKKEKGKGKGKEQEKGKGKGKGKEKESRIVQVDLNRLPPDLAKQLRKYLHQDGKGKKGKEKAQSKQKKGKQKKEEEEQKGKKKGKKGKGSD